MLFENSRHHIKSGFRSERGCDGAQKFCRHKNAFQQ
jgi:hypothetical protein